MTQLLRRASRRDLRRHRLQSALCALSVALGVGLVLALDIAIESSRRAFELSLAGAQGRATHHIVGGPSGVPETFYAQLRVTHGWSEVAPVVEESVRAVAPAAGVFQLFGIDPLAEARFQRGTSGDDAALGRQLMSIPGGIWMEDSTAAELGLDIGTTMTLRGRGRNFDVTLIQRPVASTDLERRQRERILVCDIATAQELLGRQGYLDRIDVRIDDNAAGRVSQLRELLPPGCELQSVGAEQRTRRAMTDAFLLNLRSLSLLALVVATFLIFNAMTFSVLRRRELFGRLRAIGVSRGQILRLVLGECLGLGVVGTALGIALGIGLGTGLIDVVSASLRDLYFAATVQDVSVSTRGLLVAIGLGLGATLVAGIRPAIEASLIEPRHSLLRSSAESGFVSRWVRTAVALALVAAGCVATMQTNSVIGGYTGLSLLLLGFALATPAFTILCAWLATPLARMLGGAVGVLAVRGVSRHLSRTGVAIAALSLAFSMSLGVGVMIDSFRVTVIDWLGTTLPGDVYVSTRGLVARRGSEVPLPPSFVTACKQAPGVRQVHTNRVTHLREAEGETTIAALGLPDGGPSGLRLMDGSDPAEEWSELIAREEVLISEPFSRRRALSVGDTFELRTDRGKQPFRVAGVFSDYSSDSGYVALPREVYDRWWDDRAVTAIAVFAEEGADVDKLATMLRTAADDHDIRVAPTGSMREGTLEIFDRTFTITRVFRLLAVIVATIGIFSALLAIQLERATEIAILRSHGLTPRRLSRLVLTQTGFLGLIAGLLAIPLGLVFAAVMTLVVNRVSFGWTILLSIDLWLVLETVLWSVGSALVAGLYPARRFAALLPARVLRGE
ncbi:MAG: FtsX-like permease family protein [Planctomycetota bacterium]